MILGELLYFVFNILYRIFVGSFFRAKRYAFLFLYLGPRSVFETGLRLRGRRCLALVLVHCADTHPIRLVEVEHASAVVYWICVCRIGSIFNVEVPLLVVDKG